MATVTELREMARTLGLWNTAMGRIDITDEMVSNMEYLYNIFHAEIEMRKAKKKDTLRHESHLPNKSFDNSKITKGLQWRLQQIEQINFRNSTENFMIVGDCATGKTSLASEIGGYALTKLAKVQYITQEDLLLAIRNQSPQWKKILKSEMLIIDDVFYIAPTDAELTTFYKAITFLSETHSLVIVTNRKLSEWKDMGADRHLAETLRKRLMANAQLIHLK
ncbi:MAG: ATP-binding protein [Clostridiales bacterium]|nr:ATP-binding protein [Clostridiales bacterium]